MRLPLANRATDVGIFSLVWGLLLWGASGVYCAVWKPLHRHRDMLHIQCLFLYGFVWILWLCPRIRGCHRIYKKI